MQGDRNVEVLHHILGYCKEIQHTMDTFGKNYDTFVSNSIYQNAVALCVADRRTDNPFYGRL